MASHFGSIPPGLPGATSPPTHCLPHLALVIVVRACAKTNGALSQFAVCNGTPSQHGFAMARSQLGEIMVQLPLDAPTGTHLMYSCRLPSFQELLEYSVSHIESFQKICRVSACGLLNVTGDMKHLLRCHETLSGRLSVSGHLETRFEVS